jgi:hypothetical protein
MERKLMTCEGTQDVLNGGGSPQVISNVVDGSRRIANRHQLAIRIVTRSYDPERRTPSQIRSINPNRNPDRAERSNAEKWVPNLSAFDFSATIDLAMMTKRGNTRRVGGTGRTGHQLRLFCKVGGTNGTVIANDCAAPLATERDFSIESRSP